MGNLIKGVHHISIKAKGAEAFDRAVHFYRDILGMTVALSWGEGDGSAAMVDIGDGIMMEIFASGEDEPGQGAVRHFALATDDVDACVKAVAAEGYEVFVEPKDVTLGTSPVRIAFCYGPVGEEIEFFCVK